MRTPPWTMVAIHELTARFTGPQGPEAPDESNHDDKGKDRMFEGREQHDQADMKSEKNRLAKDLARHDHPVEGEDAVTESNMHVQRKE